MSSGERKNGFIDRINAFLLYGFFNFWRGIAMNDDIDPSDLPEFYDSEFESNRLANLQSKWDLWDSQADDYCSEY